MGEVLGVCRWWEEVVDGGGASGGGGSDGGSGGERENRGGGDVDHVVEDSTPVAFSSPLHTEIVAHSRSVFSLVLLLPVACF